MFQHKGSVDLKRSLGLQSILPLMLRAMSPARPSSWAEDGSPFRLSNQIPFDKRRIFPNTEWKSKKKIGIKYCGGCNPTYDRVELVQQIKSRLEARFLFIRHDQQDLDGLLLINGCHRSCAGKNLNRMGIPYWSIIGENDLGNLIDWLRALNEKGENK